MMRDTVGIMVGQRPVEAPLAESWQCPVVISEPIRRSKLFQEHIISLPSPSRLSTHWLMRRYNGSSGSQFAVFWADDGYYKYAMKSPLD